MHCRKWANRPQATHLSAHVNTWIQPHAFHISAKQPWTKQYHKSNYIHYIYIIHNTLFLYSKQKMELLSTLPEVAVWCFDDKALKFMPVNIYLYIFMVTIRLSRQRGFYHAFISLCTFKHTYWYIWAIEQLGKEFYVWIYHCFCRVTLSSSSNWNGFARCVIGKKKEKIIESFFNFGDGTINNLHLHQRKIHEAGIDAL